MHFNALNLEININNLWCSWCVLRAKSIYEDVVSMKLKDINEMTDKQLEYAANDVIYLHKVIRELENMLVREKRIEIFKKCLTFLDTRVELDQKGFKEDIFEH